MDKLQSIIKKINKEKVIMTVMYYLINFLCLIFIDIFTKSIIEENFGFSIEITRILFTLFYSIVFTHILMLFKRKTRLIIIFTVYTILIIYCFVQITHFSVFKNYLPISKIVLFPELMDIRGKISLYTNPVCLFYLVPIILAILFFRFSDISEKRKIKLKDSKENNQEKIHKEKEKRRVSVKSIFTQNTIVNLTIIIFLIIGYVIIDYATLRKDTVNKFLREEILDNSEYIKKFGIVDFAINDVKMNTITSDSENEIKSRIKQIDEYFDERKEEKAKTNEMTDIFKGQNLIFITAESLGVYGIDEDLTKTLYKLKSEGIYFENYYSSNIGTIDTEFMLLTSLIPTYNKGMISYNYVENSNSYSMPSMFVKEGYTARAYHNYTDYFYNRNLFMPGLGFNSYKGSETLGIKVDEEELDFPNDIDLFNLTFDEYKNEELFFSYYMSVSGHGSYSGRESLSSNYEIVNEKYGNRYEEEIQCYLAAQMLLDQGVEALLDNLEKADLLDNTVIVIVGDHYPYLIDEDVLYSTFREDDELDIYKVPFIIWSKDIESKVETEIASSLDVFPIIGNMFGLDITYTMGTDIYSEKSTVKWNNQRAFSFLNEDAYYDKVLGVKNGNVASTYIEDMLIKNYKDYQISQWIISTNYFKGKE